MSTSYVNSSAVLNEASLSRFGARWFKERLWGDAKAD